MQERDSACFTSRTPYARERNEKTREQKKLLVYLVREES